MLDTKGIYRTIRRTRSRLRTQLAMDRGVIGSILASAGIAGAVYLARMGMVADETATALVVLTILGTGAAAASALFRRMPDVHVAARLDRASDLSSRLSSACRFAERLDKPDNEDPKTLALMEAAVADAVRVLPRADSRKAAPFRLPAHSRAAAIFAFVAAALAGLSYPTPNQDQEPAHHISTPDRSVLDKQEDKVDFDDEEDEYLRELLADLKSKAEKNQDEELNEFAAEVEALLDKASRGELNKAQLLAALQKLEQNYRKTDPTDNAEAVKKLQKTGKDLSKNKETRALGKALQKGDLAQAQKELNKLADKLEANKLSPKKQKALAKALEKAVEKHDKREQQAKKKQEQDIAKAKKKLERLQKKRDQEQNQEKKERLSKKVDEQKRELKRLERKQDQKREKRAGARQVKELHRNLKKAAKHMKNQGQGQKQQQERKLAARSLRKGGENTGQVNKDRRRITNQKKVASQVNDLKEALRRARRKGKRGQRNLFGKNRRRSDFKRRSRGGKGNKQAWQRQGKGKGKGKGQGQGKGKAGGKEWGDEHDPNVLGDPTKARAPVRDESVSGIHGKGPSTRETIVSASQKGFSSREYKQVYTKYKTVVEEVMSTEKVPSGYRRYVKRYFQEIKPHVAEPSTRKTP